jgi:hypothetical protein
VEVEGDRSTIHEDSVTPTGSTVPGTPCGEVHDIASLILVEGRLEVGRRRLNFLMVRAPGKTWRVQPVWACFGIDTPT